MNSTPTRLKVGYVVKRYPRFSETFIVNEILAHEAAGREVEIVSLYPPNDTHFQDSLGAVRASVTYLTGEGLRAADLWKALEDAARIFPRLWSELAHAQGSEAREVYQAARLACLVHERGLGHLHAHFASTATEVARLAARFAQVPYSFTAHAKDIFHESVRPADLARKLREAKAVVTVSDFNVLHLQSRFGADASRVQRLYNGLDLERFPRRDPGPRRPRIVAVGRLVEKKGFIHLVEACELLRARGRTFSCTIIGSGEEEARLRAAIGARSLEAQVLMPGPLPQREVIRHLCEAAVFAAPCVVGTDGNADGLPTVLLEAMALGTPCVATRVTGIPEIVRDQETGLLLPEKDPVALADALERVLSNFTLADHLADHAQRLIEAEFDARRNTARLWDFFADPVPSFGAVPEPGPTRPASTPARARRVSLPESELQPLPA